MVDEKKADTLSIYVTGDEEIQAVHTLMEEAKRTDRTLNYMVRRAIVNEAKGFKVSTSTPKKTGQKKSK